MILAAATRWGPSLLPAWLLAAGSAAAIAAWVLLYRLGRRLGGPASPDQESIFHNARRAGMLAGRAALGFAGLWLAFHLVGKLFLLQTDWPLWPAAAAAAAIAEALIWLYELERRIVSPRMGKVLTGLRLGLLGLLMLMLLQPVWQQRRSAAMKRSLVVLVDVSRSMQIADAAMEPHERLRLAEMFALPAARRDHRLDARAEVLRDIRSDLMPELAWLDRLAAGKKETAFAQLAERREELGEKFQTWQQQIVKQTADLEAVLQDAGSLDQRLKADLLQAKATLTNHVAPKLDRLVAMTGKAEKLRLAENFPAMHDAVRRTAAGLAAAAPVLESVGERLDALLLAGLPPADRAEVDAIAGLTRLELAKAALLRPCPPPAGSDPKVADKKAAPVSLLDRLRKDYDVKVCTFASTVAEADPGSWGDPVAELLARRARAVPASAQAGAPATSSRPATAPAAAGPALAAAPPREDHSQRSDLGGALRKVLAEEGEGRLAGVMVFSDGRDNGPEKIEPLARQLGGQAAAFCAAVMGSPTPPPDAAIISLEAPETVFLADKMYVSAELKLDGLAGKDVRVTLYDGDQAVDSRTVHVPSPKYRTTVQLGAEPKKPGLHACRVEVQRQDGEVFDDNNAYGLTLSVVDDKTRVLLVESRPRWEFRYLKNLFSGRDKTVFLQYVLLSPDRFTDQPPRPKTHAEARRKDGREEATLLPETEAEWMKFAVIILGDVARENLSGEQMEIIRKFVADRGGTVVFVAGPRAMPGDFRGTPLAELIPLALAGGAAAPDPQAARRLEEVLRRGFRIAPTTDGAAHVVIRQDVDQAKSREVWESLPPLYWRSAFTAATPAATVLAYAVDHDAPPWLLGEKPPAAVTPEKLAEMREDYQRKHALVTVAPHGLGKVMMLSFDQTWRLRHSVGDVYHHKFWGQVLRWATEGELPAGTHLVKLGSDRTRYPPHSRPKVRAKIVREDFSPVVTDMVAVKVFQKDKCVARVPMQNVKDSHGMYQATLDELPAGSYRLELDAPAVAKLLARDGVKTVSTEISVDPSAPTEEIELSANEDLLRRLANLSRGGLAVPPHRVQRVCDALPTGTISQVRPRQFQLWDSWLLLAAFCALATAEWVLRKKVGLA